MSIVYCILIAVLCMVLTVAIIMLCKVSHSVDDDEVSFKKSREYKVCDSCGAHVYSSDNSTCSVCGNTVYFGEKVKTKKIDFFDHIPSNANTKNVFDHIQKPNTRRRQTNHVKPNSLESLTKNKEDKKSNGSIAGIIALVIFIINLLFSIMD